MRFRSKISKIDNLTPIPKSDGSYLTLFEWENGTSTDSSIKKINY